MNVSPQQIYTFGDGESGKLGQGSPGGPSTLQHFSAKRRKNAPAQSAESGALDWGDGNTSDHDEGIPKLINLDFFNNGEYNEKIINISAGLLHSLVLTTFRSENRSRRAENQARYMLLVMEILDY